VVVRFECRTVLALSPSEAFERSLDIDLHMASMARSRERAVAGVTSGRIGPGEQVTWRAWHFGVPLSMTSRITAYDEPRCFIDEQVRGPFRSFRHVHRFEPTADGTGAIMTDEVEFVAPFGPLGRIAEVVLGPYLRHLIEARNAHLAERGTG
jgi:ligand-binding SRPBCC domain-containing protein